MYSLKGKRILIISPQNWGKMKVSKHHFAVELANRGNEVYFLNPPSSSLKERVLVEPLPDVPGLFIIHHRLVIPYNLKFHAIRLFHYFMKMQVAAILKKLGRPVDIVWSFDLGDIYPFRLFPSNCLRIFHPVDEPLNQTAINSAKDSDIIFSVTREILEKYTEYGIPSVVINHGVSEIFLQQKPVVKTDSLIKVGFSGNLLRKDIDRAVLLQIIQENPALQFEFWGSIDIKGANMGGDNDRATTDFLQELHNAPNAVLHGAVSAEALAKAYSSIDAFLICYDIEKDQSKGTNYHKIMEFLSTGKIIISNNVTAYHGNDGLIQMTVERTTNKALPTLFKETINRINEFNSPSRMEQRIAFARDNTYGRQIERIEVAIESNCSNKVIQ